MVHFRLLSVVLATVIGYDYRQDFRFLNEAQSSGPLLWIVSVVFSVHLRLE